MPVNYPAEDVAEQLKTPQVHEPFPSASEQTAKQPTTLNPGCEMVLDCTLNFGKFIFFLYRLPGKSFFG